MNITKRTHIIYLLIFSVSLYSRSLHAQPSPIGGLACEETRSITYADLEAVGVSDWRRTRDDAAKQAEKACLLKLKNQASQAAGIMTACRNTCIAGTVRSCSKVRSFTPANLTYSLAACINRRRQSTVTPSDGTTVALTAFSAIFSIFSGRIREYQCEVSCNADVKVTDTCGDCSFCPDEDVISYSLATSENSSTLGVCVVDGVAYSEAELTTNFW